MQDAGRIGFVVRGDYDATRTYEKLDIVYYNGASYVCKKDTTGNAPEATSEYWQTFAEAAALNTADKAGYVAAGAGNPNKVWKTDENGVPGWREDGGGGGVISSEPLAAPTNVSLINNDESVIIKWEDPADTITTEWDGTLVLRKVGSIPKGKTDGVVVVDSKVRDQYLINGFIDNNLTNGVKYYYGVFPYTTQGVYTYDYTGNVTPANIYPTAPTGLKAVVNDARVAVHFEKPSDATGVRIVYKTGSAPANETDGSYVNATTSPCTITGLANNTKYYIKAISYNAKGRFTAGTTVMTATPFKIVTWADGTWAEIAKMLTEHYAGTIDIADYWSSGDARTIDVSAMAATGVGETHAAQTVKLKVIGLKHDDLVTAVSGKTKAAVTFQLEDCLNETGYMNDTNTNVGGWNACKRRTWCNDIFYNALPAELRSLIKLVSKKTTTGSQSTAIETTQDKIFLTSAVENGLRTTNAGYMDEGTTYEYYQVASNRIKKVNGSAIYWWGRSPLLGGSTCFCGVYSGGGANYSGASYSYGLAPALCI